ncbi:glycoside hydrolase family 3 protein [Scrofimicrobium sp. R131]|uniref:beta-N-acetylhexosaminidase n=1 Tax=Scrofimicrobium appendicitidis TaxID=3079930 RepID=A0AAU7V6D4_9ACTO
MKEQSVHKQTVKEALAQLETWDDEHLVGQLFSVASGGHAAKNILGFGDSASPDQVERAHEALLQLIRDYHLGAIIYFPPGGDHEPVADIRRRVLELQAAAEVPLLISTDQENGTVARVRVGVTHLPGAMALGATGDEELWRETARATAAQLRSVGIAQTLAPVADVNVVAENPGVNIRSAGSDPHRAARQLAVTIRAWSEAGLASTLKHFPGYGSAAVDPHLGLPSVGLSRDQWDRTERLPFQAAIEAGADTVMLGHVAFPALDPVDAATFSRPIVTDLLRHELGFTGVIITDALDMGGAERPEGPAEACVSALQAGVDQLLMPVDLPTAYEAVLRALREGRLDRDQLVASARRILTLKAKLQLDEPIGPGPETLPHQEQAELARRVATAAVAQRNAEVPAVLTPGAELLLIHPGVDPQKRGVNPGEVLGRQLRAAGHGVTELVWTEGTPWPGRPDTSAREAVLVLRDAWKEHAPVAEVLAELSRAGLVVHVVALRSPYEAASVAGKYSVLLTYGDNQFAVEAAGRVLLGEEPARGGLPMGVPTPADQ